MKITVPYTIELRSLSGTYRRRVSKQFGLGSVELTIPELTRSELRLAARLKGNATPYGIDALRGDRWLDLFWYDNRFWLEIGSPDILQSSEKDGSNKSPFAQLVKTNERDPHYALGSLNAAKAAPKIKDKEDKARALASQLLIMEGRLLRSCTEPVFLKESPFDAEITLRTAQAFDPPHQLEGHAAFGTTVSLLDPLAAGHAQIIWPDPFMDDLRPSSLMNQVRSLQANLASKAAELPIDYLKACRALSVAINETWIYPTRRVRDAIAALVELPPVSEEFLDQFYRAQARHYPSEHATYSVQKLSSAISDAQGHATSLLPEIDFFLGKRISPELASVQVGSHGVARRAETQGDVLRAARIASVDALDLVRDVRDGMVDVVVFESVECSDEAMKRRKRGREPAVEGVRLTRAGRPSLTTFHFLPHVDRRRQREFSAVDYPTIDFADSGLELAR